MTIVSESAADTDRLGERLGSLLAAGDMVALSGELGAGKTALAQGIARGLGVTEPVSSPTFALIHEYAGRVPVWHLDVYRLSGPQELLDLGWDELLEGGGVVLLEWPERVLETLPGERLDIHLEYSSGDTRQVTLTPHGERARTLLGRLREGAPSSC